MYGFSNRALLLRLFDGLVWMKVFMKYLLIFPCLLCYLFGSLSAELVTLRASSGKEANFVKQSVSAEGITVMQTAGYRSMLLKWEQLDQEWLQKNQPKIWKEKLQLDRLSLIAYDSFYFGQTQDSVVGEINKMKAVVISGEYFGETKKNVLWVCQDPDTLRHFIRFSFNHSLQLNAIEVRMNFDSDEDISKGMESEWERLIEMVEGFNLNPIQRGRFPITSKWKQEARVVEKGHRYSKVTHRWSDDSRDIEILLEAKKVDISFGEVKMGKITFFGSEADMSSVVSTASNSNWVVYRAHSK